MSATLSLAKPAGLAARFGARHGAPAPRRVAAARARTQTRCAAAPQWSTDKTLYGEEKVDLKVGERLQCVPSTSLRAIPTRPLAPPPTTRPPAARRAPPPRTDNP